MTLPSKIFINVYTVETCFIGNWLIDAVGFAVEFNNLCLEPISRNSVFDIFNVSLLALNVSFAETKSKVTVKQVKCRKDKVNIPPMVQKVVSQINVKCKFLY